MTDPHPQGSLTTVHVVKFLPKPPAEQLLAHLRPKQPVPMAIEYSEQAAKEIVKEFQERIERGDSGTFRIHVLVYLDHR